jgi:hypothetical protein
MIHPDGTVTGGRLFVATGKLQETYAKPTPIPEVNAAP